MALNPGRSLDNKIEWQEKARPTDYHQRLTAVHLGDVQVLSDLALQRIAVRDDHAQPFGGAASGVALFPPHRCRFLDAALLV